MSLIFDTHAHYDDEAFDVDRETLLASMPEHGVGRILDPGCDLESSRRAVELARTYPHVYAAVGWHPENCAPYTAESLDTLRDWAREPKVVAIGEIGLDYYWEQNPPRELAAEGAFAISSRWRRSWTSPSSCTTARRTPTVLPSCRNFPLCAVCSTASPAASRWRASF